MRALIAAAALLAACTPPTRVVEVKVPVEVPGPTVYREIPPDLLQCEGKPALLRNGMTGKEFIEASVGWQNYALCLEGRLKEVGGLSESAGAAEPHFWQFEDLRRYIEMRREWARPDRRQIEARVN